MQPTRLLAHRASSFQRTWTLEKRPSNVSEFVAALKRCSKARDLEGGRCLHSDVVSSDLHRDKYVATALLNMYNRCGCMCSAREVFDEMIRPDVVAWTSLIMGYVENGQSSLAFELYTRMSCKRNYVSFIAGLKACGGLAAERSSNKDACLQKVMDIHEQVCESGLASNMFVACTLLGVYCKCRDMVHARHVFDTLSCKDTACWTSLILGYVENGESSVALDLFSRMDCQPDSFTFSAALKACAVLASEKPSNKDFCLKTGVSIHEQLGDFRSDVVVATSLLEMYCKCGSMQRAREIFNGMKHRNVVTWNSLILGYVETGEYTSALEVFKLMDCQPESVTYVGALKACRGLASLRESEIPGSLQTGKDIHKQARARGLDSNMVVGSCLVDMYSRCRCMELARTVFDNMCSRDIVTWNSLMLGYVENGENESALELYRSMELQPDFLTFVAALKACRGAAVRSTGQEIHARVCKFGLEHDQVVGNCLVDFYGKCGDMTAAEQVLDGMAWRNIVSWTALVAGYTRLGDTSRVFSLVKVIEEVGLQLNDVTLICLLTACSHAGLVDEAKKCFDSMPRRGIRSRVEHYSCMIDMLGRANRVEEAVSVLEGMPFQVDHVTWTSLLGACRKWNNVHIGRFAFDALVCADSRDASAYQLMTDIYKENQSF